MNTPSISQEPSRTLAEPEATKALAEWLVHTDPISAKLEATSFGRAAARIGRSVTSNGFNLYNYGMGFAGLAAILSRNDVLPPSVDSFASSVLSSAPKLFFAAFGTIALAKAASILVQSRHSFTDARARGLGLDESLKHYGTRVVAEAQSRILNPYAFSAIGLGIAAFVCYKFGAHNAEMALKNKVAAQEPRSDAFLAWRAGVARKAFFMTNPTTRSAKTYREAARLLLASRFGHFDPTDQAPSMDAANAAARDALAFGFEHAYPTPAGFGLLATNQKPPNRLHLHSTVESALDTLLTDANDANLDPEYTPREGFPNLAFVLSLCAQEPRPHDSFTIFRGPKLSELISPWSAFLEAQELRECAANPLDDQPTAPRKSKSI